MPVLRLSDVIAGDESEAIPTAPERVIAPAPTPTTPIAPEPMVLVVPTQSQPVPPVSNVVPQPVVAPPPIQDLPPQEALVLASPPLYPPQPTPVEVAPLAPVFVPVPPIAVAPFSNTPQPAPSIPQPAASILEPTPVFDPLLFTASKEPVPMQPPFLDEVETQNDTFQPTVDTILEQPLLVEPTIQLRSPTRAVDTILSPHVQQDIATLPPDMWETDGTPPPPTPPIDRVPEIDISALINSLEPTSPPEPETLVEHPVQPPTPLQAIGFDLPDMWETATPAPALTPKLIVSTEQRIENVNALYNTPEIFKQTIPAFSNNTSPQASAPLETVPVVKKADVSGTNLSSLRERILQQSVSVPPEQSISKLEAIEPSSTTPQESSTTIAQMPTSVHAHAIAEAGQSLRSTSEGGVRAHSTESTALDELMRSVDVPEHTPPTSTEEVSTPQKTVLPTMRTLRSDVASMVTHNKTSVVDMISAEEKKRGVGGTTVRLATQSRLTASSYLLIGASIALVLGTIVVGVMYYFSRTVEKEDLVKNFFFTEMTQVYDITNKERPGLMSDLRTTRESSVIEAGKITEIRLTETLHLPTTALDELVSVTPRSFLTHIDAQVPSTLSRSLADQMMLGLHQSKGNQPYLIFTVNHYENAFSGMMEWESTMSTDLTPLFESTLQNSLPPQVPPSAPPISATSSTTTPPTPPERTFGTFGDRTIANVPVRVLTNSSDEVVLLWSMPDNATIVITTSPDTLENIRSRMTAREY